jgi:hypothetical protein
MVKVALLVRLEAKPGKEDQVAKFLTSALALANQEATTPVWFAIRSGGRSFVIFDAFADEGGPEGTFERSDRGGANGECRRVTGQGPAHRAMRCACSKAVKGVVARATDSRD